MLAPASPPSCFSLLPSPMAESGRAMGSKTCMHQNVGQASVLSYRLETAVFVGRSLRLLELAAIAQPYRAIIPLYGCPPALKRCT